MTLLRDIQAATTDQTVDISTLLRKAKILAARLRNAEFEAWVDHELNGYEDQTPLAAYRVISATAKGTLTDGWRILNDFQIMTTFLPEKFKDWGDRCYLRQPIATLASLAKREQLSVPWHQELAVKYGAEGTKGLQCIKAWQDVNADDLHGVLDTVRTRLLAFSLKLEAENPDAGEGESGRQPIPDDTIRPLVINTFYGAVGTLAQNSQGFTQTARIGINLHDLARLVSELKIHLGELGLDAHQEKKVRAQIEVIRAELDGEPDEGVIAQSGRTLRNVLEGSVASLVATAAQPTVWHWIHQMLTAFR